VAVRSIPEFDSHPADYVQWAEYYNYDDDTVYQQVLPLTTADTSVIATTTRLNGTVTVVTTDPHGLVVGDGVTLAGVTLSSFDGSFIVASVVSTTSFTHVQAGADVGSTAGTAAPTYPLWEDRGTLQAVRDSVRPDDTLTRAKYLGRDYTTFRDEGLSWLRGFYNEQGQGAKFTDFVASDFGIMLASYVSAAMDTLSWYMDREVSEGYFAYAKIRERMEVLARIDGYKPRPATACTADETISLPDGPYAFDVPLSAGDRWQGPNGLIFHTAQDVLFAAGETEKTDQPLIQGEIIEETFVVDKDAHFRADLGAIPDDTFIAQGSVEAWFDGVPWDEYDFLPFARVNAFEITYGADPPIIATGDGVIGNAPDVGTSVVVRYIATKGKLGNAATEGTITTHLDTLVVSGQEITLSGTNPATASGGDDIEPLDEVRANAPDYFKTAQRGTTRQDMTTLASTFSSGTFGTVAKAKANIVRGIADDLALQALLASIDGHQVTLQGHLDQIDLDASEIIVAKDAIAAARLAITDLVTVIETETASISTRVTTAKGYLSSATGALDAVSYQQVIGIGDGVRILFSTVQMDRYPVAPGTVSVWSDILAIDVQGTNGDADATAGVLTDTVASNFTANMAGRALSIGGEVRQITEFISVSEVRYSGTALSGTGLSWIVYDPGLSAVDDGNGGFTGTGFVPAESSIDYTNGSISIRTTSALPGDAAQGFGVNLMAQFGYEEQAARTQITNADTELDAIDVDATEIESATASITTELSDISAQETVITDEVASINAETAAAAVIPADIESDVDDLEAYLDAQLSSECRANIVIVQVLVVDVDGFYAAPTQALLTAVKTDLEVWNVVPTTIATVSGFYNVVAVDMLIKVKILDSYVFSEVAGRITPVIDNLFKGRDYDADLYRSQYYNLVVPDDDGRGGVTGVDYGDLTITATSFPDPANTGTPPQVDTDTGNLIIGEEHVLTRGTITIQEIT
jgi:hypothetical protein